MSSHRLLLTTSALLAVASAYEFTDENRGGRTTDIGKRMVVLNKDGEAAKGPTLSKKSCLSCEGAYSPELGKIGTWSATFKIDINGGNYGFQIGVFHQGMDAVLESNVIGPMPHGDPPDKRCVMDLQRWTGGASMTGFYCDGKKTNELVYGINWQSGDLVTVDVELQDVQTGLQAKQTKAKVTIIGKNADGSTKTGDSGKTALAAPPGKTSSAFGTATWSIGEMSGLRTRLGKKKHMPLRFGAGMQYDGSAVTLVEVRHSPSNPPPRPPSHPTCKSTCVLSQGVEATGTPVGHPALASQHPAHALHNNYTTIPAPPRDTHTGGSGRCCKYNHYAGHYDGHQRGAIIVPPHPTPLIPLVPLGHPYTLQRATDSRSPLSARSGLSPQSMTLRGAVRSWRSS